MGLRPKVSDKIIFNVFEHSQGEKVPPSPWTGEVIEVKPKISYLRASYLIRRDADSKIVTLFFSRDIIGYVSE